MMPKTKIKNVKSVFNAIEKVFKDTLQSQAMYDNIATFTQDRVVTQTRLGNDLTTGDKANKQPPLADGYVKYWKRVQEGKTKIAPDPRFFSPKRSNLTLTGQLLNSIKATVVKSKRQVVIEPTGKRDDGLTNKEVASELADNGRKFLGLDLIGVQRIRRMVLEVLRRNIRNFNK